MPGNGELCFVVIVWTIRWGVARWWAFGTAIKDLAGIGVSFVNKMNKMNKTRFRLVFKGFLGQGHCQQKLNKIEQNSSRIVREAA
jgi:hypothetical protein